MTDNQPAKNYRSWWITDDGGPFHEIRVTAHPVAANSINFVEISALTEARQEIEELRSEIKRLHDKYDYQVLVKQAEADREQILYLKSEIFAYREGLKSPRGSK